MSAKWVAGAASNPLLSDRFGLIAVQEAGFGGINGDYCLITHQNTLARAPARVLNSEVKNKSSIPLNSVVLRRFVSLKNKGLSGIVAKPLIIW